MEVETLAHSLLKDGHLHSLLATKRCRSYLNTRVLGRGRHRVGQGLSCGVFRQFSTRVARAGMLSHPKQEVKTYRSIGASSRTSPIQYIPQNTTGSLQNCIVSRCILKSRETLALCWQVGDHF